MDISSINAQGPSVTQGPGPYTAPAVSTGATGDDDAQAPGFQDDSLSISAQGQALSGAARPDLASTPNTSENPTAAQPINPSSAGALLGAYSAPGIR
jgi:hypothetical protein